jgi:CRISPR-associated exonuclease Cas4
MTETDDLLALSGIQHFLFCRRQWALIHIEKQWVDNYLTVEGNQLHEKVNDSFFTESRAGTISSRSVPVRSNVLGIIGVCDLVEFSPSPNGVALPGREGLYQAVPVEYKRGIPKEGNFDEAQLCAQAICLEEMLSTTIESGYLYYARQRRRTAVTFTDELRQTVIKATAEMRQHYRRNYTPKVKPQKHCKSCSLVEICLPKLQNQNNSVTNYITAHLEEDE